MVRPGPPRQSPGCSQASGAFTVCEGCGRVMASEMEETQVGF